MSLIITGVIDGPLSGGVPKAIELTALTDIADLSVYGIESANNGAAASGAEFTLSGSASAGDVFYVASESTGFTSFFGFAPDFTTGAASINGDDAIVLYESGGIVDVFGEIGVDGTGTAWDHLDGWAYRVSGTGPDGATFAPANWTFSGINALDGETSNDTAAAPFPAGTYAGGTGVDGGLVISEIMYNPASTEDDWEWVEITNTGATDIDLTGYVIDDINSVALAAANIDPAVLAAGASAVLYNGDDLTSAAFEAAWGTGLQLIAVSDWSAMALNNGGDTVAIWDSFTSYSGDNETQANAIVQVAYDDSGDWPVDDGAASIYLTDLAADANDGANWALSAAGDGTPTGTGRVAAAEGGNSGADIGSPGGDAEPPVVGLGVPYAFDFESDFGAEGWTVFSADADTANSWYPDSFSGDNFAEVNAFGDSAPADDWLISPAFDLDATDGEVVTFQNTKNFDDEGLIDPEIRFVYSTDYTGSGDPTAATWTELPYNASTGGYSEVSSGQIDISGISGDSVHFAFNYRSSGTGAGSSSLWQIDDFAIFEPVEATERRISEIQGAGDASPLVGTVVTVEAVMTADFQDAADSDYNGFFLQEEDADSDGDPLTSEGIFVYEGGSTVDVEVGDLVQVTGTVAEYNGETQISSVTSVSVVGSGAVTPAIVAFPTVATTTNPDGHIIADLEQYEGMLVTVPEEMTVGDLFTLGRYNEVGLTSGGRIASFTQTNAPDQAAYAAFQQEAASRALVIDDAFEDQQNLDPIFPAGGLNADTPNILRSGDTVSDLTGVIAYREPIFDASNYRLVPTEEPDFQPTNPREPAAPEVGGDLTVASFNVLNYFTSLDTGAAVTGPAGDQEPRGAEDNGTDPDGLIEFERQEAKLVAAINEIAADVVGLIEIENDPLGSTSIAALVSALNASGQIEYDYVDTGPIEGAQGGDLEGDAIKVGFIYNTETVELTGDFAILDETVDSRFQTVGVQRPAVAQTFTEIDSGESFTAAINHFKSKGSVINGESAIGDGQGNNNPTRTAAAEALVDWLETDPTGSGDEDFLILGDLNSYLQEDPIQAILDGADDTRGTEDDYVSLVDEGDYSYGFPIGLDTVPHVQTFGTLDYALATSSLSEQVTGSEIWHINADEATALDYNLNFQSSTQHQTLFNADPFRASDHDPVVLGLDLQSEPEFELVEGGPGYDRLIGSDANEIFIGNGGTDIIRTGGGTDIVDLAPNVANGSRDVSYVLDFDVAQDMLGGITAEDVRTSFVYEGRAFPDRTTLLLESRDVVMLFGVSDPDAIQYDDGLMVG